MEHTTTHDGAGARRTLMLMLLTAAVAAVIAALSTVAALAASGQFDDVTAGDVHEPGIGFMAETGVTAGCNPEGTEFCPEDSVTRAQMATFMHRLSGNAEGVAPSVDAATLDGMDADELLADVVARLDDLEAENAELRDEVDDLNALLADITRAEVDGNDTLTFSGMNLQLVNGEGETDTTNGLGNLIVGYNGDHITLGTPDRTGSHSVVVGDGHDWSGAGALIAGTNNRVSADAASILGGDMNQATEEGSAVLGGRQNVASGDNASVVGGQGNDASGSEATVLGGQGNEAAGVFANAIAGGRNNTIEGGARWASILGQQGTTFSSDLEMHPN